MFVFLSHLLQSTTGAHTQKAVAELNKQCVRPSTTKQENVSCIPASPLQSLLQSGQDTQNAQYAEPWAFTTDLCKCDFSSLSHVVL